MVNDVVWKRTEAKETAGRPAPGHGYWRWNIKDPYRYTRSMSKQVRKYDLRKLTPERLMNAIEEDSHQKISVKDCQAIMRKAGV